MSDTTQPSTPTTPPKPTLVIDPALALLEFEQDSEIQHSLKESSAPLAVISMSVHLSAAFRMVAAFAVSTMAPVPKEGSGRASKMLNS